MAYAEEAEETSARSPQLEQRIRRLVVDRRPQLKENFGRSFRKSQSARPLRYGFVGNNVVAKFAMLSAKSAYAVGTQVDRAKVRLWGLKQLDDGILADSLPHGDRAIQYELLVNQQSAALSRAQKRRLPAATVTSLKAAEEELEAESDKYKIDLRLMPSPEAIAEHILRRAA